MDGVKIAFERNIESEILQVVASAVIDLVREARDGRASIAKCIASPQPRRASAISSASSASLSATCLYNDGARIRGRPARERSGNPEQQRSARHRCNRIGIFRQFRRR